MLRVTIFSLVLYLLFWMPLSEEAQILVVFTPPSPSNFFLGKTIVQELANRGHEVTFISSFGSNTKDKNFTDIVLTGIVKKIDEFKRSIMESSKKSIIEMVNHIMRVTNQHLEKIFNNTEVQDLIKSNKKFDLVIILNFFAEGLFTFGHLFKCPVIVFSPFESSMWVNHLVANPEPVSYIPQLLVNWPINMNFWQRTKNFLFRIYNEIIYTGFHMNKHDEIVHKYFPNIPPLREIIKERLAVILLNSSPVLSPAKPLLPNMIEIGGFHIKEPKPLPKELQNYLNNATEGFILFSMGSNLKSTMLPPEKLEMLINVFAKLPHSVLWKFEEDQMIGKPDNVRIEKWLPQNDILAHPNLKLFITQGGVLSTTEAVYHGVPVVGIPVFGDQKMNMLYIERLGIGRMIEYHKLSQDELLEIIQEVLSNKTYKENMKIKSVLFRDKPLKPLDTAMYWIEYVVRHKYLNHLKTSGIHLNWYQIQSLDVIAFLGFVLIVIAYTLQLIFKKCVSLKSKYYNCNLEDSVKKTM